MAISGPLAVTPNNNPRTPRQPFTHEVPPAAVVSRALIPTVLILFALPSMTLRGTQGLIKAEFRGRLLASGHVSDKDELDLTPCPSLFSLVISTPSYLLMPWCCEETPAWTFPNSAT